LPVTRILLAIAIVAAAAGTAAAYPQYQLSVDATCSGCHVSPSGGGLLNENGTTAAETYSWKGTNPEFMYGKLDTGDHVQLGGDFRGVWGYLQTPQRYLLGFPMQGDLYAHLRFGKISVQFTGGFRPPQYKAAFPVPVWSREHYVMWQQNEGSAYGLFVRAGRFMPVFGLRLAEHPVYVRRFGGVPLYGETYGVGASYVTEKYEAHATGFIKDPFIDPVLHDNGGAVYGEYRVTGKASVGVESMYTVSTDDKKFRGGVTGKVYVPGANLLVQGELQFVNQQMKVGGGAPNQIVGYVMGSVFLPASVSVDLGLGHYDENLRIKNLDRDCVDVNVHWFVTSHFEAVLNSRVEMIGLGSGGPTGAYAFLQGHYRL
jgi:hypothetical protein